MNDITLQLKNVYKSYGGNGIKQEVLKGVDLIVARAEIVYITGPSGSGKSTLLNICGLLDNPDKGEVLIDNQSVNYKKACEIRLKKFSYVFQHHSLIKELNILENVLMVCYIMGLDKEKAITDSKLYLEKVGLINYIYKYPSELSGGERQRVAIARALVKKPEILLLDEPTGDLDVNLKNEIEELIYKLTEQEKITTVIVTHEIERIKKGSKVFKLDDGKLFLTTNN
ncbi:MAG: ABC transporter ATP-binding protein [Candidatus Hydrogenedentota bacterium]